MRHLVSVLCVWMLRVLPANAQQGREEEGLLGPVSTVAEERAPITSHYGSLMEGPRIRTQKMVYDERDALLERILYGKRTVYRYKYDPQGNWIEKHVIKWRNL